MDRGAWWARVHRVTESDTTETLSSSSSEHMPTPSSRRLPPPAPTADDRKFIL